MRQLKKQEKKYIKVVLDTNILISAFLFQKQLGTFLDLIENETIIPFFIESTFLEFQTVLKYKKFESAFSKTSLLYQDIVSAIENKSKIIPDPDIIPNVISDIADNYILACALGGKVDFVVSGDNHLLKLKNFKNIPIITPKEFLEIISEKQKK